MAAIKSAEFRQGTTPILTFTLEGEAVQDATVYVTIRQGDIKLRKSNFKGCPAVTMEPVYDEHGEQIGTAISVIYSQWETLHLRPTHGQVQVRWVRKDKTADESLIGRVEIGEALDKRIISYG
jgi:hypothetical protein